ncbi:MAG: thiol:disulfide interchange protein [Proteobacteria bacterium]|jgi:thiol:disulfide interchange protein DsbD|nr:thiol:disulfide interchange protein [Pseudomonadota bacterium]MBT4067639.1 thiol:disulfide interchange protein [Candidatus Neomarinimicrobiota bacterium]
MNKKKSVNSYPLITLILFFLCFTALTASAQKSPFDAEPLAAEEAFQLDHIVTGPSEAVIRWQIPQFYYLYKEKFAFSSQDFIIEDVQFPVAQIKEDPFFGASEVYHDVVEATLRLTPIAKNQKNGVLNITYQGCWEGGICYPLLKTSLTLSGL